jgi:hypothetical protein
LPKKDSTLKVKKSRNFYIIIRIGFVFALGLQIYRQQPASSLGAAEFSSFNLFDPHQESEYNRPTI